MVTYPISAPGLNKLRSVLYIFSMPAPYTPLDAPCVLARKALGLTWGTDIKIIALRLVWWCGPVDNIHNPQGQPPF